MEYIVSLLVGRHFMEQLIAIAIVAFFAVVDCFISNSTNQVIFRRSEYFFAVISALAASFECWDLFEKWLGGEFDIGVLTPLICILIYAALSYLIYGMAHVIICIGYHRKREIAFSRYLDGIANRARDKDELYDRYNRYR